MAHPAFWPTKTYFYPIGNTPPICLTQNVPPEANASILLLGCGDPRNILYSLYSERLDDVRKFDITCCDMEPAILARNILLFSLIADDAYPENTVQIWNIFYHFFLDEASNALLLAQSRKLAMLSADMETWHNSEYSTFLRVSSRLTLTELSRLWTLYAATGSFSAEQRGQLKAKFIAGMKSVTADSDHQRVVTGLRAAGPLHSEVILLCMDAHRRYWEKGVTFDAQRDIDSASIANPTFAYTAKEEGFLPHYATCPAPAFHLAAAVAPLQHLDRPRPPTVSSLFISMKTQFAAWCSQFREMRHRLIIRFIMGDVLATCHTLVAYADHRSLTAHERLNQWSLAWLALDGDYADTTQYPPPSRFHVIDTSNLVDHIGLLNIVLAAAPLLAHDPVSSLFTETLLTLGEDPLKSFTQRLCCDPSTLFLLLDLVPTSYVTGFTTQSNVHEIAGFSLLAANGDSNQYHERMIWKVLSLASSDGHPALPNLSFEAVEISDLLLQTYLQMFSHEDMASMIQKASLTDLRDRSAVHYGRRTFALFVKSLKDRVTTEWPKALDRLSDLIAGDKQLMVGLNYYQDLLCQLDTLGIYTPESWLSNIPPSLTKDSSPFSGWKVVPTVACLVMSVPRSNTLAIIDDPLRATTPMLHVQLVTKMNSNAFTSLYIAFGTISVKGSGEDTEVTVTEDPRGKFGDSPLVVVAWVPTWLLTLSPSDTIVTLNVVSTPFHARQLISELGLALELYRAPLVDSAKSVHVVKKAPAIATNDPTHLQTSSHISDLAASSARCTSAVNVASLDKSCRRIVSLTQRIDFSLVEPKIRAALSNVKTTVTATPVGAADIELAIGADFQQRLHFPPLADNVNNRLRIARKSSWIEVVLPVREIEAYTLRTHSLVRRFESVASWNIHYMNLECLPALRMGDAKKLDWLNTHVSLAFSDAESVQRKMDLDQTEFAQVKDSIHCMMNQYAGTQSLARQEIFALDRKSNGGIDTLIFVTHLRLDLPAHTVILDAYILPLDDAIMSIIERPLLSLMRSGVLSVFVSTEELVIWKHLFPALAERCRTWIHKKECAYIRHGKIPLSVEHGEIPICDCGQGIVTSAFKARKDWAPFTPYVTRVAISPLFALSYLESMGQRFKDILRAVDNSVAPGTFTEEGRLQCASCGKKPPQVKLSACSVCKSVQYCGRQCQVADWKKHKAACRKV